MNILALAVNALNNIKIFKPKKKEKKEEPKIQPVKEKHKIDLYV